MLKFQLNILRGYREIPVQKLKVIKSHLNIHLSYFLPKSPNNYIIGGENKNLSSDI